jgi:eukaryotic-like serine/threonine-protein kinase
LLCDASHPRSSNPARAIELATKAVELDEDSTRSWTALGMARYRDGQWPEAVTAFETSLGLVREGMAGWDRWDEALDWFFLSMCYWRLGDADEAHHWYGMARDWTDLYGSGHEGLRSLQAEVEKLMTSAPHAVKAAR